MMVSYSGLSMYKNCPAAFRYKYIDKAPYPETAPSYAMKRGTRIHGIAEEFILDPYNTVLCPELLPYEEFLAKLAEREARPELKFAFDKEWQACDFDDQENGMLRGVFDALHVSEDGTTAMVTEFKTGKKWPDHRDQIGLYGLAGLLTLPKTEKVSVSLHYIDGRNEVKQAFYRTHLDGYKWVWQRRVNETRPPQPYKATPNWKCKWCPYSGKHNEGPCNEG